MLIENIRNNWKTDIFGYAQIISLLEKTNYPAWTIKNNDGFGVAIPYEGEEINESFSSVRLYSMHAITFKENQTVKVLALMSNRNDIENPFATLCAELINPGDNGAYRKLVSNDPVAWWKKWKELLGNKNIDARIYDVLGELCVLYNSLLLNLDVEWNGPDGASYDIETETRFIEVKSTVARNKREISISNQFQLFPQSKPLDIVLCVFEPTILSGISINSMITKFANLGYNTEILNQKLLWLGFEEGMSSRNKKFILHEMLRYTVADDFPRITPESFVGGCLPTGVCSITYTVDLSGLTAETIDLGAIYDL